MNATLFVRTRDDARLPDFSFVSVVSVVVTPPHGDAATVTLHA